ncbi:MAG: translation initiation factor IF-5A [Candidatus Nanohaloarchaea archaeon]|nr:translation initiation factor IF-5A [Candidatus Nanohaloarchaea archaeon]
MPHQIEAKSVGKGDYIMLEDEPCKVKKTKKSAPGKHGHAKYRIQAVGVFDDKTRNITKPGDAMLMSPDVDKKVGQIVSKDGDIAQVMDMETYETEEMQMPDDLDVSEGEEIRYWVIADKKMVKGKHQG